MDGIILFLIMCMLVRVHVQKELFSGRSESGSMYVDVFKVKVFKFDTSQKSLHSQAENIVDFVHVRTSMQINLPHDRLWTFHLPSRYIEFSSSGFQKVITNL